MTQVNYNLDVYSGANIYINEVLPCADHDSFRGFGYA